MTAREAIEQ